MRKIILAALIGFSFITAKAQFSFQATIPADLQLVKVNATNVNLRKAPNAQSPRLMWSALEGEEYDAIEAVWSNHPGRKSGPCQANKGEVYRKTGQTGEWTRISTQGHQPYLLSKFVTTLPETFRPLTTSERGTRGIYERSTGQYAGYCILLDGGGMDTEPNIYLGRKDGNAYVFCYKLEGVYPQYNESQREPLVVTTDGGQVTGVTYNKSLNKEVEYFNRQGEVTFAASEYPAFERFTDRQLEQIFTPITRQRPNARLVILAPQGSDVMEIAL